MDLRKQNINEELLHWVLDQADRLNQASFVYKGKAEEALERSDASVLNAYVPIHKHPYMEICVLLKGEQYLQLDSKMYGMMPGSIGCIHRGSYHSTFNKAGTHGSIMLWAALDNNRLRMHLSSYGRDEITMLDGIDLDVDSYLLQLVEDELQERQRDSVDYAIHYIQSFWRLVNRKFESNRDCECKGSKWKKRIVHEVDEYVNFHIAEKISLKALSDAVYLSPSYLSFLFKELMGINLFDYIQQKKIDYARELLKDQRRNINEIACQVGFPDPFYFTRVFKKKNGVSPSEYRAGL